MLSPCSAYKPNLGKATFHTIYLQVASHLKSNILISIFITYTYIWLKHYQFFHWHDNTVKQKIEEHAETKRQKGVIEVVNNLQLAINGKGNGVLFN